MNTVKNILIKTLSFYLEFVGFLVALLFFILSSPVSIVLKISGLSLEERS